MNVDIARPRGLAASSSKATATRGSLAWLPGVEQLRSVLSNPLVVQIAATVLAYYLAGKLGQATTNIRSGNLGPVWPAAGIALAALLAWGYRVWPGVALGSFLVAYQSPVLAITAMGQAAGATLSAAAGVFLMRQLARVDPKLPRLRDAIALIVLGAFVSALFSASIGIFSLYITGFEAYSGLASAWLIYWLGDATGVLLVTPLVLTLPALFEVRSRKRAFELVALLALLIAACGLVFGDLPVAASRLLGFAVLPFVMWAAIKFGVAGASLSVFLIATSATLYTALGLGPFSANSPFDNAILLDVFFTLLAVSGLAMGSVIAEREHAEAVREELIRAQAAMETRLRLAAIVESSNDAILATTLDGIILSWNAAAERILGFTEAEAIGQSANLFVPPEMRDEEQRVLERSSRGEQLAAYESIRLTKRGVRLNVSVTLSPLRDAQGHVIGTARILRDITAQKRAEEALASVGRRLIEAQEQERSRIARELHDDIAQRLSLLAINLSDSAAAGNHGSRPEGRMFELQQRASELAGDVQALSHRLHSPRIELLGLVEAMRHFCAEFTHQENATVRFTSDVADRVPSEIAICLFRILQEALHNATKHSGVHQFEARLWSTRDQIHLVVSDHGKGFDPEVERTGLGIGLISMQERIKLVDGVLTIESAPNRGTTIRASVPSTRPRAVSSAGDSGDAAM